MKEQIKPELAELNKLIAEFMGYVFEDENIADTLEESHDWRYRNPETGHTMRHLLYNREWNWLMPVIEKISNLEIKFLNADRYFNPYPITFGMQNEDGLYMFRFYAHSLHSHQNLIDAAYTAVVEFLTSHMKGDNNG